MRPPPSVIAAISLLVALSGCTDGPAENTGGSRQAQVAPSSGDEPDPIVAPDEDNAAERQAKQAHREPGSTEEMEIDWTDAASHPRADTSSLSDDARAAVEAATLPVLLPRDASLLTGAVVTRGPTWYAASLHPAGHHITINGRKLAVHQPSLANDVPEDQRRQPGETTLSRTHGIVDVAFEAFGASYTLNVECEAPTSDVRCTEDEYALSLVRDLGVAGGAP
jgi:hypothetical protein